MCTLVVVRTYPTSGFHFSHGFAELAEHFSKARGNEPALPQCPLWVETGHSRMSVLGGKRTFRLWPPQKRQSCLMILLWASHGVLAAPVTSGATGVAMNKLIAVLAMSSILTSPAWGSVREAALLSTADPQAANTSLFAGASYRVGLDRRSGAQRGRASLKVAGMRYLPGSPQVRFGDGLELTGGRTGKPALHLAGQDFGQLRSKAQLDGTGTALIVGGVLLLGVLVAVVASDIHKRNKCSEEEDFNC